MGSLMGSFFGQETNKSADETMAVNGLGVLSASALAYFAATLESVTPEVRRLFNDYCSQNLMAQEALNALALKKGWIIPYEKSQTQLENSINESMSVLSAN
jgi:spore coat protein CotF